MKVLINLFPLFLFATTINFQIKSENYSDFMPISELFSKWKTYYYKKGVNYFLLDNKISFSIDNYGVYHSLFLYGKTNNDTAYLIYVLNSKSKLKVGQYNVNVKLKGYETKGLFYFKNFPNFKFRINIFKVINHQDGYLTGQVIVNNNNNYNFRGYADYYFSKNYLYHWWDYEKSYGYGGSFDLYFNKKINNIKLKLSIEDIGRLYIKNSPHSIVYINSSNKTTDEEGYITYNPIVSGRETYEKHYMNTIVKYTFSIYYKKYILALKKIKDINMPYIGFYYKNFTFQYNLKFKTLGFNVKYKLINIAYFASKINPNKASSLGININFLDNF